jgi:hypothetical protein
MLRSIERAKRASKLTGSSIGDLPIILNRQYKQSAAITGLSFAGGNTNRDATTDVLELILMVTPRIVREAHDQTAGPVLLLPTH